MRIVFAASGDDDLQNRRMTIQVRIGRKSVRFGGSGIEVFIDQEFQVSDAVRNDLR